MVGPASDSPPETFLIADVERSTGVPRATLRIWERRYGFPQPLRSDSGERVYTQADLRKLRLIQQLVDAGARPGGLVTLPEAELLQRLEAPRASAVEASSRSELVRLLRDQDSAALLRHMRQDMARLGLHRFVMERAAPWSREVGDAWNSGDLQVFEEHLFAHALQMVLGESVLGLSAAMVGGRPRVLLATVPGELHVLGLSMVHALLALEGCHCAVLGASTPHAQIVKAASWFGADVVGLSFSAASSPARAQRDIALLREQLPPTVELWIGGSCAGLRRSSAPRVRVFGDLAEIGPAVADYRDSRA